MRTLALVIIVLAVHACADDRHIAWERNRQVLGPIVLKDRIAYTDSARDRVMVVDLQGDLPHGVDYKIGRRALYAMPSPDRAKLLVLTRGEEALREGMEEQEPALWVVDVTAPDSPPVRYSLGSPFDRIAVTDDGRRAVAYYSESGPDSEGFFRNPNELAFVDLDSPADESNPIIKTVRSFGSAPIGVSLSPPMTIPGATDPTPRVFALVLAPNNLTVVDTTNPTRNEISIRLNGIGSTVVPRELVFVPERSTAYLRSEGAGDILEIAIAHDPPTPGSVNDNDYRVALAELGTGGGPADIAVYDDLEGRRMLLAATPSTREVVIIDAGSGAFERVPLSAPVDRILLFPAGQSPRLAVFASLASARNDVQVLALDGITDELVPTRLQRVELQKPVRDVVPVPGSELAMIVHDDDRTVLGLLDVGLGAISPLEGVGRLDSFAFSSEGSYLIGASTGIDRVGFVELDNLHPSDTRLDAPASRVFSLSNGKVLVEHDDPLGLITVLAHPGAGREQSYVLSGFLTAGLFDEEF